MGRCGRICLAFVLAVIMLPACVKKVSNQEGKAVEPMELSQQLRKYFYDPKVICFGRYAISAPLGAQLNWGTYSLPSPIDVNQDTPDAQDRQIAYDLQKLKIADKTSEIIYNGPGPVSNSWLIRYFEHIFAKEDDFYLAKAYLKLNGFIFLFRYSRRDGELLSDFMSRIADQLKSARMRSDEETPVEPGYCIEHGFLATSTYNQQETVSAGIYIPGLPDVTFSVSSNKDAYSAYSSAEFEGRVRGELSLLARITAAQDQQGINYPKRTVLREGKRTVQHWKGEESLIRRADGTHDFEWAFVGTPGDVANPSEFSVQMYTKVAHNTVGAADKASLTDEEAIALWDKLLSGLKFRVKVPGAPEGSYYFLPGAATDGGGKP